MEPNRETEWANTGLEQPCREGDGELRGAWKRGRGVRFGFTTPGRGRERREGGTEEGELGKGLRRNQWTYQGS